MRSTSHTLCAHHAAVVASTIRAVDDASEVANLARSLRRTRRRHQRLHVDHLDGTTKAGNVAAFLSKGTLDDLRAELAKCEVVCANCHHIRTKGRVPVTRGRSRR